MSKKAENGTVGSKWAKFKRYLPLYLMFLPGAIYLFVNNYLPMTGIVVAFKNYNARKGIWGSPWAGLKNFEFLFASPDAWVITRNTLLIQYCIYYFKYSNWYCICNLYLRCIK